MKTTVEIPDPLLRAAKRLAERQKTTLRVLIEEGLRKVIRERSEKKTFKLRKASVEGKGLQPGIREGDWNQIREIIYEGRGG